MSIPRKVVATAMAAGALLLAGCAGAQASPARTLESAYQHIAESEFEELCDLIDPRTTEALARRAGSCQAAMASDFSPRERANLSGVTIRDDLIDVQGDVARIAEGVAVTPAGPATTFKMLIKHDGKWWIAR